MIDDATRPRLPKNDIGALTPRQIANGRRTFMAVDNAPDFPLLEAGMSESVARLKEAVERR